MKDITNINNNNKFHNHIDLLIRCLHLFTSNRSYLNYRWLILSFTQETQIMWKVWTLKLTYETQITWKFYLILWYPRHILIKFINFIKFYLSNFKTGINFFFLNAISLFSFCNYNVILLYYAAVVLEISHSFP